MGRAARARHIAARAAYGGGIGAAGMGVAGMVGAGLLAAQARVARRALVETLGVAPPSDGVYQPDGKVAPEEDQWVPGSGNSRGFTDAPVAPSSVEAAEAVQLLALGDSLVSGVGAEEGAETLPGQVALLLAERLGRPVRLVNRGDAGATSLMLAEQVAQGLAAMPRPDVALVVIGANDVVHRLERSDVLHALVEAVRRLRTLDVPVVVGTCPDFSVARPLRHPLKALLRRWSRDLAAAQTVAVVEAGARTVSTGDVLLEEFRGGGPELFSGDGYHPSPLGYARAARALLPSLCAALGLEPDSAAVSPDASQVEPLATAAAHAIADFGTEVAPAAPPPSGGRGPWARISRRR